MSSEVSKSRRWWLALVVGVVAAVLLVQQANRLRQLAQAQNRVALVLGSGSGIRAEALRQIVELGPEGIEGLDGLIRYRDTALRRKYRAWWPSFPQWLKDRLADPLLAENAHEAAVQAVRQLGPVHARPLTSALCAAAEDEDGATSQMALLCLYWSVPESPKAAAAVGRAFADPSRLGLYPAQPLETNFWEYVPKAVPSLVIRLRNLLTVSIAAESLGAMGGRAEAAIPALIEVAEKGAAAPEVPLVLPPPGSPVGGMIAARLAARGTNINQLRSSGRAAGIRALGKIGVTTPPVLAVLDRALHDPVDSLRMSALLSLHELKQPLGTNLTNVLNGLGIRLETASFGRFNIIGQLGEDGREALPWLRQFTSMAYVQALPPGIGPGPTGNRVAESIRRDAIIAVCRIDPRESVHYLDDVVEEAHSGTYFAEALARATPPPPELCDRLEIALSTNVPKYAIEAADLLLRLQPANAKALALLRSKLADGSVSNRMIAAAAWWRRTGEAPPLVAACRDAIKIAADAPTPTARMNPGLPYEFMTATQAINLLRQMGPAARPAIPVLKAVSVMPRATALGSDAAQLLLTLAPGELPPIR